MEQQLIESINMMTVNGNRLELPETQLSNYAKVKKTLTAAGGKYSKCGFTFKECAEEIKARLVGGEAIDDVKKFQYFPTPPEVVMEMTGMIDIDLINDTVLEPSAGQMAIIDHLKQYGLKNYGMVELMPQNCQVIRRRDGDSNLIEGDFLSLSKAQINDKFGPIHKIVANPPFTKGQDVAHVKHMYDVLEEGGSMVSLVSPSFKFNSQKKFEAFRDWLNGLDFFAVDVPAGAFKSSGTNVATVMLVIHK